MLSVTHVVDDGVRPCTTRPYTEEQQCACYTQMDRNGVQFGLGGTCRPTVAEREEPLSSLLVHLLRGPDIVS